MTTQRDIFVISSMMIEVTLLQFMQSRSSCDQFEVPGWVRCVMGKNGHKSKQSFSIWIKMGGGLKSKIKKEKNTPSLLNVC
nr:hypothetical protein [Tanacetum cinerariifolium]